MSGPDDPVAAYIATVTPQKRKRDAEQLRTLMERATGEEAQMWGSSIVGFGRYEYKYASGRQGEGPAAAFSPRKAAMSVYLVDGIDAHAEELDRLGPHTSGVGCLYLKDLETVDQAVLEQVVSKSYATLTAGTYGLRAREGGKS